MNKKYSGLVSNPRNTKDTQVVKSITYTTNGTVVETVNLNAWPAAIEGNTPEPTPPQVIVSVTPELPWTNVTQGGIMLDADYSVEEIISHLAIIGGGEGSEQRLSLSEGIEHDINVINGYAGYLDKFTNSLVYSTLTNVPSITAIEWQ